MKLPDIRDLSGPERTFYRDSLRQARYAALADAEAFHQICFALEGLGLRLMGREEAMGPYWAAVRAWLDIAGTLSTPEMAVRCEALYKLVQRARNDAMHTGAYARHVSAKAVELCLILEDALMNGCDPTRCVRDHMVKEPVSLEAWNTVGRARQLMLTHSFSNLPVRLDGKWYLVTEHGLAQYLSRGDRKSLLAKRICDARTDLNPPLAILANPAEPIDTLLADGEWQYPGAPLWLVLDEAGNLEGIISASELL